VPQLERPPDQVTRRRGNRLPGHRLDVVIAGPPLELTVAAEVVLKLGERAFTKPAPKDQALFHPVMAMVEEARAKIGQKP
jgi:malonyl CoA-acyl carrier protein transacylase